MSDYKLVPVEPTPEWVANLRKIRIDRMESVIEDVLAAAPAVQGEPVARVKTVGGYPDESEHVAEWLCKYKDLKDGDYLYLVQQPAEQHPDVAQLIEAASAALDEIEKIMHEAYNSAEPVCCGRACSECCGSPEPEWSEFDQNTMDRLDPHQRALADALATHRKQEGNNDNQ